MSAASKSCPASPASVSIDPRARSQSVDLGTKQRARPKNINTQLNDYGFVPLDPRVQVDRSQYYLFRPRVKDLVFYFEAARMLGKAQSTLSKPVSFVSVASSSHSPEEINEICEQLISLINNPFVGKEHYHNLHKEHLENLSKLVKNYSKYLTPANYNHANKTLQKSSVSGRLSE